jgi:hypothetical protein
MRLEENILDRMAKDMAREIDKEILEILMIDMLTDKGWIKTKINPTFNNRSYKSEWYAETAEWVHMNATGDYKMLQGQWLFKEPKDATMFILRWA